jgi:outer membrane protein OmpA-like peptidoglycan-associated protein
MVRENGRLYIRRDETEQYRLIGGPIRTDRRGDEIVTIYDRPNGDRIVTVTDENGRLLRRIRRRPDGSELVIIDNGPRRPVATISEEIVELPPPERLPMPAERYIVDAAAATPTVIYEALTAPPVAPLPKRYTVDQIRYSKDLRARMPSVDLNTITFESGSYEVPAREVPRLATIAEALKRAIAANPKEVFLIEGHTDAVGSDVDNMSLSDRRAQSVAAVLTSQFGVPPENLMTQGYGEQNLKVPTQVAARENRRVTVRRITPLLAGQS